MLAPGGVVAVWCYGLVELGPEHMLPGTWWPLVMALGAVSAVLGIKFTPVLLGVGAGVFLLAGVGWFVDSTPLDNSEFSNVLDVDAFQALAGSSAAGRSAAGARARLRPQFRARARRGRWPSTWWCLPSPC